MQIFLCLILGSFIMVILHLTQMIKLEEITLLTLEFDVIANILIIFTVLYLGSDVNTSNFGHRKRLMELQTFIQDLYTFRKYYFKQVIENEC